MSKVAKLFTTWENCLEQFRQDIRQIKKERRNEAGDVTSNKEYKALGFMQHMVTKVREFRDQHQKLAVTIEKTLESEPTEKTRVLEILAKAYGHMQNIDVWDPNR